MAIPATPLIGEVTLVQPEIQRRLLDSGLGGSTAARLACVLLHGVVELLLADGAFLGERRVAVDVELRLVLRRLRLCQVALRLLELSLKLARIDLEEQRVLGDDVALLVVLREDVPASPAGGSRH